MIKYIPEDTSVVFSEVPGEISLTFSISNCAGMCEGCHSPYLRLDTGDELTTFRLGEEINKNPGVSCVLFLGEGRDPETLKILGTFVKNNHPDLKVALYSGRNEVEPDLKEVFDYVKVGPYIKELGPLNSRTTNQRLYMKKEDNSFEDITYKFWRTI